MLKKKQKRTFWNALPPETRKKSKPSKAKKGTVLGLGIGVLGATIAILRKKPPQ